MDSSDNPNQLASSVARSPFFRLSAELRNQVYRLVLVIEDSGSEEFYEDSVIVDASNGIPEPALLLTNKIIRSEAADIFHYENDFCCYVENFDPAPVLLLQSKLKVSFSEHPTNVAIERRGNSFSWDNLVAWLHKCHRRECEGLLSHDDMYGASGYDFYAERYLLHGLFTVAVNCPEIQSSTLDTIIGSMYLPLVVINRGWYKGN